MTRPAMMRRTLLAGPALLLSVGAAAQQRLQIPLRWYVVQIAENVCTVELPGIPDHRIVNDRSARGTPFVLHSYSLEAGGYSYAVQTALYPVDVDTTQPRRVLQAALDARAQNLESGKWTKVDWREIKAGAAVDSMGTLSAGRGLRQVALLKERRFISLAFLGGIAGMTGVEAERFFTSLKLA